MNRFVASFATAFAFFSLMEEGGAASQMGERAQTNPVCKNAYSRLSEPGKKFWDSLVEKEVQSGTQFGYSEIINHLLDDASLVSGEDGFYLFTLIAKSTESDISWQTLQELVVTSRAAVATVRCDYTVEIVRPHPNRPTHQGVEPDRILATYASDGEKRYLKQQVFGKGQVIRESVDAYDGEVLRTLMAYPDREVVNSSVARSSSRVRFFPREHPIRRAMLLDSQNDLSSSQRQPEDVAAFIQAGIVFPGSVQINGIRCVAVSDLTDTVYCAPELGYAVIESRLGEFHFDNSKGGFVRDRSVSVCKNSDFQQLASGVWLPKRSEYRSHLADGNIGGHVVTTVGEFGIESPADLFTKVIPDGAVVSDAIQDAVYVAGADESLQSRLSSATPRAASPSRYTLLVTLNVLALCCLIGFALLRRRAR